MVKRVMICACLFFSFLTCPLSATYEYDFRVFNNPDYQDIPELVCVVEVWQSAGQAVFQFSNNSSIGSVITQIYFDDESLLEFSHFVNFIIDEDYRLGTRYNNFRVSPRNLPAANLLDPVFRANPALSAQPYPAPPKWGIGRGETLQMWFDLKDGHIFGDVINALNSGTDLRIGMRIQCLGPEGTDSAAAVSIPEPATICLFGLAGLTLLRRRRQ